MPPNIADRIQRITSNLLPDTGLDNTLAPPAPLAERMARHHTPGVSIAVIDHFELAWAQGFGHCDARSDQPVIHETLFQAGSISKPVFALAVMRLVQEGVLDLDEDVNHYLTSWQVTAAGTGWQPRITLRQILSHSAGLTVHGFPGYRSAEDLPTVPQLLNGEPPANTPRVEVNILPGLQFRYSGGGTTVAQQLVVDVLQNPFPDIMHELVFEPLGLIHSTYAQPLPAAWAERAATAHPSKGTPLEGRFHTYPEMAAAGLWTTADDLARIGVDLMQVLNGKKEATLLRKETIESMLHPQLAHQQRGENDYAGLGFFCKGKDEGFHFGHGGWDEGFVAELVLYPRVGQGAVVMVNSNEGYPLLHEITRSIAREYSWPGELPEAKTEVPLGDAQRYTGLYTTESGTQFRIDAAGGRLALHLDQQPPLPLSPSAELEFFTSTLNTIITFQTEENGSITGLALQQAGNRIKATKQGAE